MTDYIDEDIHSDHEYSDEFEEGSSSPLTKHRTNGVPSTVTLPSSSSSSSSSLYPVVRNDIRSSLNNDKKTNHHVPIYSIAPSTPSRTVEKSKDNTNSSSNNYSPNRMAKAPTSSIATAVGSSTVSSSSSSSLSLSLQKQLLTLTTQDKLHQLLQQQQQQGQHHHQYHHSSTTPSTISNYDLLEQIAIDMTVGNSRPFSSTFSSVPVRHSSSDGNEFPNRINTGRTSIMKTKALKPLPMEDGTPTANPQTTSSPSPSSPSRSAGTVIDNRNTHGGSPRTRPTNSSNKLSTLMFREPTLQDEELGLTSTMVQERHHRLSTFPAADGTRKNGHQMNNRSSSSSSSSSNYHDDEVIHTNPAPTVIHTIKEAVSSSPSSSSSSSYPVSSSVATDPHQQAYIATRLLRNKLYDLPNDTTEDLDHETNYRSSSQRYASSSSLSTDAMGASPQFIPPPLTSLLRHQKPTQQHTQRRTNRSSLSPKVSQRTAPASHQRQHPSSFSSLPTQSTVPSPLDYHNAINTTVNPHPPYGFKEKIQPPTLGNSSATVHNYPLPAYTHPRLRSHITDGTSAAKALGLIPSEHIPSHQTPWAGAIPVMVPGIDGNPRTLYLCESIPSTMMMNGNVPPPVPASWLPSAPTTAGTDTKEKPSSSSSHNGLVPLSDDVLAQIFLLSTITGKSTKDKEEEEEQRYQARANGFLALTSSVFNTDHNYLHNVNNNQAIRLLQYSNQTPLTSPTTTKPYEDSTGIGNSTSNKYDTTPTPLELASQWSTVFDELYKETILHLPSLIINSVINLSRMKNTPSNDTPNGTSNSPPPIPLPLNLAIASPLSNALTDMLTDVDVVTLIREAVAARVQARIVQHGIQQQQQQQQQQQ